MEYYQNNSNNHYSNNNVGYYRIEAAKEAQNDLYDSNYTTNGNNIYSVSYGHCNTCLCYTIVCVVLVFGGLSSIINEPIFSAIVIAAVVILSIPLFIFSKRNIDFEKFQDLNILTAKVYNYLGCRCKKKTFNYLNNIQFDVKTIENKYNDNKYRIFIFNNLSDLKGFNENQNIRNKPIGLYYYFDKVKPSGITEAKLKLELNYITNK